MLDPKVTKQYGCFKKLAIALLNLVTGVTVAPALFKKYITGTFLYSFQGKSNEAVDETQKLFKKLSNDASKLKKKKLGK